MSTMADIIDRMLLQWVTCDIHDIEARIAKKNKAMNWIYSHDMPVMVRDDLEGILSYLESSSEFSTEVTRIKSWLNKMDSDWSKDE